MAETNRPGNQSGITRTQQQQNRGVTRRYDPMMGLGGDLLSMSPFAVMRRLSDEMDRLFGDTGTSFGGYRGGQGGELSRVWSPAVEVRQQGDNLLVRAELPGIDPKEVNVEVNNDTLVLEGERKSEQSSDEGGWHRSEISYGRFYRAIPLPEGARADQARANYNNGVLEITVPVEQPKENRRRIEVQGTTGGGSGTSAKERGTSASSATAQR